MRIKGSFAPFRVLLFIADEMGVMARVFQVRGLVIWFGAYAGVFSLRMIDCGVNNAILYGNGLQR